MIALFFDVHMEIALLLFSLLDCWIVYVDRIASQWLQCGVVMSGYMGTQDLAGYKKGMLKLIRQFFIDFRCLPITNKKNLRIFKSKRKTKKITSSTLRVCYFLSVFFLVRIGCDSLK